MFTLQFQSTVRILDIQDAILASDCFNYEGDSLELRILIMVRVVVG